VKDTVVTTSPSTQPTRNISDERLLFGDKRIRIVAMMGTELRATATATGRVWPSPA
jgi:DNA-binding IclR family transcriptional regulator